MIAWLTRDVVCPASCPQIKGISPAGSIAGELLVRCKRVASTPLSVSDQGNEHHDEDGEQHGDDKEIAKDFDADLAAGHSRSIAPCQRARLIPIRITPDVGTTLAACRANEPFLDIRQPNVIRPSITAHPDIVAATIVLTKDQEPAHALGPEFGEGDFLRAGNGWHAP